MLEIRRLCLRRLRKLYGIAFAASFGAYFVFAFFDPGLLSYDVRQKFQALADELITVTATVLGPPQQPVVTGVATCNSTTGVLSIALDWATDPNSSTYDINRDSLPLVSGLTNSAYTDTTVVVNTTYQYEVTGNGPMGPGFATSLPVSVTTPTECAITAAAPAVTIVSFAGRGVDAYNGTPRVGNRRPIFTGTTNMPGATMLVTIGSSFLAQFVANSNGYWEWKPPYGVATGRHMFTVTATDPNNSARQATATLKFDITKNDETGKSSVEQGEASGGIPVPAPVGLPLSFTLSVENPDQAVLQGEMLQVLVHIDTLQKRYAHLTVPIRYSILDTNRVTLYSETYKTYITEGEEIRQTLPVPMYFHAGAFSLQAEILLDDLNISRLTPFTIQELPLIRLSSGDTVSYADLIRHLGWITFAFFILFLIWLSLFIREFALYLQGDREVTEYDLKRAGFIRK